MALPKDSQARRDSVLIDVGGSRGAVLSRDALSSTVKYSVPLESVQFVPGDSATKGILALKYAPVCDLYGVKMGGVGDTSFSWAAGLCLDTEVVRSPLTSMTDDEFLLTLQPGQYAIDYALGKIYYSKKTDTDLETCSYVTRQQSVQVRTLCENQSAWEVNVYTIGSYGTGQPLPSMDIPNGMCLVIRAQPDNTGNVYISHSKIGSESSTGRIQLAGGAAVTLYVSNADLVWWNASTSAQKIEVYTEVSA